MTKKKNNWKYGSFKNAVWNYVKKKTKKTSKGKGKKVFGNWKDIFK